MIPNEERIANALERIADVLEKQHAVNFTLRNEVQEAQNQLSRGEITINQARQKCGLSPIGDEVANVKLVKRD